MALKPFEYLEQFKIITVLKKLIQLEKTGSMGIFLIPQGNLKLNSILENGRRSRFYDLYTFAV